MVRIRLGRGKSISIRSQYVFINSIKLVNENYTNSLKCYTTNILINSTYLDSIYNMVCGYGSGRFSFGKSQKEPIVSH